MPKTYGNDQSENVQLFSAERITIVQKPETARQPDIAETTIDRGCIDFVISAEQIAQEFIRIANTESADE